MGALSPSATIIIVLVCCACLVVVIAAVGRHYYGDINDAEANYKVSPEQAEYMPEVTVVVDRSFGVLTERAAESRPNVEMRKCTPKIGPSYSISQEFCVVSLSIRKAYLIHMRIYSTTEPSFRRWLKMMRDTVSVIIT
ncbi:hypothetical protein VTO58DRAFT_102016 [Aureobasidium pullulans]